MGVGIELAEVQRLGTQPHRPASFRQASSAERVRPIDRASLSRLHWRGCAGLRRTLIRPHLPGAIQRVLSAGGVPVVAHPVRLGIRNQRKDEEAAIAEMRDAGLLGIEVQHSDHSAQDRARYQAIADKYQLAPSGGSDFHGAVKPQIKLGSGIHGNVRAREWLTHMREIAKTDAPAS